MKLESDTREYLRMAYRKAMQSPDPSSHVGAVLVDEAGTAYSAACNTFPNHVEVLESRLLAPYKYQYMVHAERGVVYDAAMWGLSANNSTMYAPWASCVDCAQAIIQAGVAKLVVHDEAMRRTPDRWLETIADAHAMLRDAGVEIEFYQGFLGDLTNKMDGKVWNP